MILLLEKFLLHFEGISTNHQSKFLVLNYLSANANYEVCIIPTLEV